MDIAIVGAGPAGLAAAATFMKAGYTVAIFEKGCIADAISRFPYYMRWFSTADRLELAGMPLIVCEEKPTREEYLAYLRRFVHDRQLDVRTQHLVTAIARREAGTPRAQPFVVQGYDRWQRPFQEECRYVVIATGGFDHPQMLGVPGEDLPKVSHYFKEVHPHAGTRVAVIGGSNSAAETALLLWRAGAEVTLVHRGAALRTLKYWLQPDIENRIRSGEITACFSAHVTQIRQDDIVLVMADGQTLTIANDYVLAMTGYQPDVDFLKGIGIIIDPSTKRPGHDAATLETNVEGVYVAGVITAGNISGEVFIENSRVHGEMILQSIVRKEAGR